jgi:hypothetical protein
MADEKKTAKRPAQGPRPAFITYRVIDAEGNDISKNVDVQILDTFRKADDVLAQVDAEGVSYKRFMIK